MSTRGTNSAGPMSTRRTDRLCWSGRKTPWCHDVYTVNRHCCHNIHMNRIRSVTMTRRWTDSMVSHVNTEHRICGATKSTITGSTVPQCAPVEQNLWCHNVYKEDRLCGVTESIRKAECVASRCLQENRPRGVAMSTKRTKFMMSRCLQGEQNLSCHDVR